MKTTIELPDELLLQAKQAALEQRTTLKALIESGLRHTLAQQVGDSARSRPSCIPVIRNALRAPPGSDTDANVLIDAIREERLAALVDASEP